MLFYTTVELSVTFTWSRDDHCDLSGGRELQRQASRSTAAGLHSSLSSTMFIVEVDNRFIGDVGRTL